ncbi:hypothetical protein N7532_001024 [Penicillium argentinense]|uniref:Multicopper oxidase n=1 Tax=Penicillium argentinense TaxID=1131581 RepID=A0A9W9KKV5_9EURO|nr:uncharacterized protein N7532_001024 [Penicillium argentinense]KAJ5110489.1 hypothetical protein N7532_001024 [Penicillium argentinense]
MSVPSKHPRDTSCVHGPNSRKCWSKGFDITTDYYENIPDTGVVREYWFNIENGTASPDGVEFPVQLINGSFPGPTIIADWGDTFSTSRTLQNNGTGLHFHGIRQNYTDGMDGVPSITQCPVAPGDSFTYRWRATEYGTGWYHSHFYVQAWDGVLGGILINGPASANYNVDLGHVFLNDLYHVIDCRSASLQAATGAPPTTPNSLINGTNTWNEEDARFETVFNPGTRYRMRLVNAGAYQHFRFMIDNHTMEVMANDFVPIHPFNTTQLSIGMGQRYDIILTGKQIKAGNFWMRAIPQSACSETDATDKVKGIIRYDNTSATDPTTSAYSYSDSCADEDPSNLISYLKLDASETYTYQTGENVEVQVTDNAMLWLMNKTSFHTQWEYPSLLQVAQGNTTWLKKQRVIHLPAADKWVYMVIHSPFAQDHPMHLHGHDFWPDSCQYPRRDVVMLPASGYVVIALKTNNPGVWLMHCHIAWHISEGFAIQQLERISDISWDMASQNSTCKNWDRYAHADDVTQYDSGV